MIEKKNFRRWFNRSFWKAFKNANFPIEIPENKNQKSDLIEKIYLSISSARYSPSIPETELVYNKGHGVARTVPIFCIEDYCVYYFCIKELEDVLCNNRTPNTFGGWRLGGKLREKETAEVECELTNYGRYSFNPLAWTQEFGEFNSLLYSQIDTGNYSHALEFDISNFYDSVRLDILERWIREEAGSEQGWIITLLFYLLNHWNRRNTGLHPQAVGLPQDAFADCSRILSNYYLQKYDKFAKKICDKADVQYFRYADDQTILLNNPDKIENLLLLLTKYLDRYGLRINQKKVHRRTVEELEKYRCRSIHDIFSQKGDNKKPALVKKFVDSCLAIEPEALEKTWNCGMPLLNRMLWANLESLPQKTFTKITTRLFSEKYLLRADHKKLKRIHELNNKRSKPIDLVKRLQKLGKKSIHNAFHYEVLTFASLIKDKGLKELFTKRIDSLIRQMDEDIIS